MKIPDNVPVEMETSKYLRRIEFVLPENND